MMRYFSLEVALAAKDGRTPSFNNWLIINNRRLVEVIAG